MPAGTRIRKLHALFTRREDSARRASRAVGAGLREGCVMAGLAMVLFIALFAFGSSYFGWEDPAGRVSLSLFASFIFGIICGYRVNK